MKIYLLPENGQFYKANLHAHSVCSDGAYTPEEAKAVYKSAGYSVYAYSDHNVLIDHSDLADENFLPITSREINIDEEDVKWDHRRVYHLNFFAKDPHNDVLPCFNPKYLGNKEEYKNAQKYTGTPDYIRDYHNVNQFIEEFCSHGFICSYNHPNWSLQNLDDVRNLRGIFAMEIYNHGCFTEGFDEWDDHIYEDMLRQGLRIGCIANDDNHDHFPKGTYRWDSLGGYTMIKAPSLTYASILDALEKGNYYASTGPEIRDLYIEDGRLYVETSPAKRINLKTFGRRSEVAFPEMPYGFVTKASFGIKPEDQFIRIVVEDIERKKAWSRAYFLDEIGMVPDETGKK